MSGFPTSIIEFDIEHYTVKKIRLETFKPDTPNKNLIYWVHCDLNEPELFKKISKILHFPESLEKLCLEVTPIPKLMEEQESIAIQLECVLSHEIDKEKEVSLGNITFYLTSNYCFTASYATIPAVIHTEENCTKYIKYAKTPCFILFLILDDIIQDFSKLLFNFDSIANQADLTVQEENENIYKDVMHTKRQVMKTQHNIASMRDILMRVSGRKLHVISDECRHSLHSLLEHSQIINSEAGAIRDLLKNTLDQIDNALMQKMSKTMQVLTSFASIFLPLGLIATIYGMNFKNIPEYHWKYGYFWALGLMLACAIFLIWLFRYKKWF